MKTSRSALRQGLIIGAAALAIRALYVIAMACRYGTAQVSDFLYMHQLADSLAHGRGFTIDGLRIFNQSVGYPAFLSLFYAVFGSRVWVAIMLNVLFGAASAWLVFELARRVVESSGPENSVFNGRKGIPLLAGGLAAVFPDSLLYASFVSAENLLVPLLLLAALALFTVWRREWACGAVTGALGAAAVSVKAHVLLWFVLVPVVWWVRDRRVWRRGLVSVGVGVLLLIPWTVANYRASQGRVIPFAKVAGTVFLDGTNPLARGAPTNAYRLAPEEEADKTEPELDDLRMRKAVEYICVDPVWYAKLCVRKLVLSFSPVRDYLFEFNDQFRMGGRVISRWVPTLFNIFLLTGWGLGMFAFFRPTPRWAPLCYGTSLAVASVVLQVVFCAYSRYRYPFLFAALPIVAAGWWRILRISRR